MSKKVALLILDGWGCTNKKHRSAIHRAYTPFYDGLLKQYPNTLLEASGKYVGIPLNTAGNSEVGHLTIGSGRVLLQPIERINQSIKDDSLFEITTLHHNLTTKHNLQKPIHILGLISDGSVHSHIEHIIYLAKNCLKYTDSNVFIHAFTDGRDTDPKSSIHYIDQINKICNQNIKIATITGRYYAMDRDLNWGRIKICYDSLVYNEGIFTDSYVEGIQNSYNDQITDEFIKPIILEKNSNIKNGDTVIFANFRKDRARQLTYVLTQKSIPEFDMNPLDINFISMTNYDNGYQQIKVLFENKILKNTLGEVISKNNMTQLRIAETEKYAHVTYFFSGGYEKSFKNETRILISSPKIKTFDLKPQMSAFEVTDSLIKVTNAKDFNFICMNYANPDMVAHTGNFSSTIKACECTDYCLSVVIPNLLKKDYCCLITSDHGNAEKLINDDGSPNTAHTVNKVPFLFINGYNGYLRQGSLSDIAPTILNIIGLNKPSLMTGKSLLLK